MSLAEKLALEPKNHERHVRWLMHQYAYDRPAAEQEAAWRYWRYPHEFARWDRD